MKKLKRFCLVILIASVVCCAAVLINSSNRHTIQEAMAAHYGTEQSQEVYSTVQAEIANYIIQYGVMTDSWVIKKDPTFDDGMMYLDATLTNGTVLNVIYNDTTGECDVEEDNSVIVSTES